MIGKQEHLINKYKHRFFDTHLAPLGITPPEANYIVKIYQEKQVKMNDIIQTSPFHKSHGTRAIHSLNERGYITKEIDPSDRRGYILAISESGIPIAQKVITTLNEWDQLMMSALTDSERELLIHLKEKMYLKVKAYFGEDE